MLTPLMSPLTGDTVWQGKHASGLTVAVWPIPTARSAYAVFATRYGSVNNTLPVPGGNETVPAGIAHYLEHKLFESEDGDAFQRFAATGASANAYTTFDHTAYLFNATDHILPSLDILLDFVRHPYFTKETVEKEQGIIAQEIRMGNDRPGNKLFYSTLESAYAHHPVKIDIAGTEESIARITPELLYRCYERYYDPHNMLLAVAGRITPDEVWDAVERAIPAAAGVWTAPLPPEAEGGKPVQNRVENTMSIGIPQFCLGYKETPLSPSPVNTAVNVLLGEAIIGKSTRFGQSLIDKGWISSPVEPSHFGGPGFGIWLFEGETDRPEEVADAIRQEVARLQRDGFEPELVQGLSRALYGQTVSALDDPTACGDMLIDAWLKGFDPMADLDALANISPELLHTQLCERLKEENTVFSLLKPEE